MKKAPKPRGFALLSRMGLHSSETSASQPADIGHTGILRQSPFQYETRPQEYRIIGVHHYTQCGMSFSVLHHRALGDRGVLIYPSRIKDGGKKDKSEFKQFIIHPTARVTRGGNLKLAS